MAGRRLNVTFKNGEFSSFLTGYAYETIPNKAITTGKTKGTEEEGAEQLSPTPRPLANLPTWVLLALGSPGLSIWRREERNREEGELR
jgi:hypothetical protein